MYLEIQKRQPAFPECTSPLSEYIERIGLLTIMITLNTQPNYKINRQARHEKITVLIVDKKQVNTVLEKNIMSLGNRVIIAECHRYAIQAATNTLNDLITINMNLSDAGCIQMISKIKEVVGAHNIVSTDTNVYGIGKKEREKQILYYVKKPLDVNEIQSVLEHIAHKKIFSARIPN